MLIFVKSSYAIELPLLLMMKMNIFFFGFIREIRAEGRTPLNEWKDRSIHFVNNNTFLLFIA